MKIDWKRKLASRKLWLAVAGFVSGLILAFGGTEGVAATVSGVILQGAAVIGYLFAESLTDMADSNSSNVYITGQMTKDDLDKYVEGK